MSVSREQVSRCADATGFRRETMEKVLRLGEIVADVGRHPFLSTALILKGGTALNLFFGAPRRLSVDLDFNYVAGVERSKMLQDRPEVERAVQLIASARGYKVQVSSESHAGRKLFLRYVSVFDNPDHIEVDLNFLMRIPLLPPTDRTMWLPEEEDFQRSASQLPRNLPPGSFAPSFPGRCRATSSTRPFCRGSWVGNGTSLGSGASQSHLPASSTIHCSGMVRNDSIA